jgi:hypothetical protein
MARKQKAGRPVAYTERKAEEVLRRMSEGESIRQIARDQKLPCLETIMRWAVGKSGASDDFPERYQVAMEIRGEVSADKIRQIITDLENGKIDAHAARVIIDAEKWIASKLHPRLYGDRREHSHVHRIETSISDRLRRADARLARSMDNAEVIDVTPEKVELARE